MINTYLPVGAPLYGQIATLAKSGPIVTLYLIGGNISRTTLKEAGMRPLLRGVLLWSIIAGLPLILIVSGVVALQEILEELRITRMGKNLHSFLRFWAPGRMITAAR